MSYRTGRTGGMSYRTGRTGGMSYRTGRCPIRIWGVLGTLVLLGISMSVLLYSITYTLTILYPYTYHISYYTLIHITRAMLKHSKASERM